MCVCVYMMRNIEVFVTSRRAVLLIFFYDSILPRFPPTSKPSPHAQSTTTVHTFTAFHHAAHDTLKRDYSKYSLQSYAPQKHTKSFQQVSKCCSFVNVPSSIYPISHSAGVPYIAYHTCLSPFEKRNPIYMIEAISNDKHN